LTDWRETLSTQAQSTVTGYFQFGLGTLAERLPARSVRLARMILIQAVRNAMVNHLVVRNVADLAAVPRPRSRRVFQLPEIAVEALRG
jgi:hypothetical protein